MLYFLKFSFLNSCHYDTEGNCVVYLLCTSIKTLQIQRDKGQTDSIFEEVQLQPKD